MGVGGGGSGKKGYSQRWSTCVVRPIVRHKVCYWKGMGVLDGVDMLVNHKMRYCLAGV